MFRWVSFYPSRDQARDPYYWTLVGLIWAGFALVAWAFTPWGPPW